MKTYTINPAVANPARKRMLLFGIAAVLLVPAGVIMLMSGRGLPLLENAGVVLFVLLFAGLAFRRSLRRMDETLPSYTLTVSEDSLLKQQAHHADVRLARTEVKTIWKSATGEIVMKTGDWRKFIVIPPSLIDVDEVERTLGQWKPIRPYPRAKTYLAFVLSLLGSLIAFIALRRFLEGGGLGMPVIIGGALGMMVLNLVLLRMLRRLPNLDERSRPKRGQYILAILTIIMFLLSIVVFYGLEK
jgi:hypothetical protein